MNKKKYIWFSFYKQIVWIKNIDFKYETYFTESRIKNTENNYYYQYNNKEILNKSLHNLIFLLKYFEKDFFRLNAYIVIEILKSINLDDFIKAIQDKPNSEFLRKIWFLIESYLKININLWKDFKVKKININLLNKEIFITNENKLEINKKYKILDNSLWKTWEFNPILIKEKLNNKIFSSNFNKNLKNINSKFDSIIIEKTLNYLYTKETKWSLEIEGEKFIQSKNRWFLKLISNIPLKNNLNKKDILEYYNKIYSDNLFDYRKSQNYIGSWNWMMWENIIEYISPKDIDLDELMESLILFYNKNKNTLNPILLSVILSVQFVLIHPFLDWNWRTSRFLFQYSLLNSWIWLLWMDKVILPVSAYILINKENYYKQLENISNKLLDYIHFEEKINWEIEVLNETKYIYTNLDFSDISNYFYKILEESIDIDYKKKLNYINNFYSIYKNIDSKYNITSNNISFITKVLIENNWLISNNKLKMLGKKWVSLKILKEIEKFTKIKTI